MRGKKTKKKEKKQQKKKTTEGRKDRGIVSFSLEYEIHVGKTKTMWRCNAVESLC